ncbi:DNA alkylation repair enzyme [Mycobacteroides abscessus]|uniref:DNA alkylation repair protein n=3 Tax=Mycobacteroides abscessus TaxID=36809 RepID=A0A829I1Q7_9MYCO|nr:DNA alkylation repair protein [Mycobacteroides abscessus]ESV58594.1 DNA alkylation repair enzyme family protein [Mycobacteroides abscessus MAB_082312_2258]ESV61985.1 DNA alkylation repair enzyme family protein [Mycobacteroides abscessus MAB_091912_2446]AIC72794.1 DNA alkylation repair protein [Mycobacteroides abscessus subsp. massiliense str. GO 06]AMU24833.1 DNA alkylation repair protein [Mycobacteroides abscessus]AMU34562.1 DNA alkylation repair protein [Mycobacteroides abscessus]
MAALNAAGDSDRAGKSARFFKTGPGEYGEGDVFLGVSVPEQRKLARGFRGITHGEVVRLLASDVHEHRLTGLILAVWEFTHADMAEREAWAGMYLAQVLAGRVNNWDLVDSSAEQILGEWLVGQDYSPLLELAADEELWRRRVGIIGTFAFIRRGDAVPLLSMAPLLIDDRRDLVQKAFGWMLRESGKRCGTEVLLGYLDEHAAAMGRTALSYATEHLDAGVRARYRAAR